MDKGLCQLRQNCGGKNGVHIPNWKRASPYPQPERDRAMSPSGWVPVHIPKGLNP